MWGLASCSITCPDGQVCSSLATCCKTMHGYSCCPYPNAVCCSDLSHCCPSGFSCNLATQMCEKKQSWMNIPMVKKEAAEKPRTPAVPLLIPQELENNQVPDQQKSSVVYCDSYTVCPDGYSCCKQPTGHWYCCPYSPGWCCRDGYHCCPYGYDCDYTYTRCIRRGLLYPFTPKLGLSSVPAAVISTSGDKSNLQEKSMTALTEASSSNEETGVIRCDSKFFCSQGSSCCKGPKGQWNCCPHKLGQCCSDGKHCCEYGYTCDATSSSCKGWFSQTP